MSRLDDVVKKVEVNHGFDNWIIGMGLCAVALAIQEFCSTVKEIDDRNR